MGATLAERIERAEAGLAEMVTGAAALTERERATRATVTRARAKRAAALDWAARVGEAERLLARQYVDARNSLVSSDADPATIAERAIQISAIAAGSPTLRETVERARVAAETAYKAVAAAEAAARDAINEAAAADPELQRAERRLHLATGDPFLTAEVETAKADRAALLARWRQRMADLERWLLQSESE